MIIMSSSIYLEDKSKRKSALINFYHDAILNSLSNSIIVLTGRELLFKLKQLIECLRVWNWSKVSQTSNI